REGNVWMSTNGGLDRFRDYTIPNISRKQGLSTSGAYSVQATADGTVLIGTPNGVNRWDNRHVTAYGEGNCAEPSGRRNERKVRSRSTEITNSGFAGAPRSLGLDDHGRLWVSSAEGMFYFES